MSKIKILLFVVLVIGLAAMVFIFPGQPGKLKLKKDVKMSETIKLDTATFGSGCFWCTEALFERLKGVHEIVSGYSGGSVPNPSYEAVCTGKTGHAEVTQILYDPN